MENDHVISGLMKKREELIYCIRICVIVKRYLNIYNIYLFIIVEIS